MKKSLIFALCVFSLLFTLVIFGASADEAATPVSNAAEFEAMKSGGNYILTADIDLGGKEYSKYIFAEFHGTIDGDGHTVKNFSIVGTADGYNAMIACTTGTIHIKDLTVGAVDAPISVTGAQKGSNGSAVLLGTIGTITSSQNNYACIIDNVDVYGNVNITGGYKAMTAVFIAQGKNVIFNDCEAYGTINVQVEGVYSDWRNAGGFMGSIASSSAVFKNCVNNVNIKIGSAPDKDTRAGGFVGYTDRTIVFIDCVNNGNLELVADDATAEKATKGHIGGFVGQTAHYAGYFTNCKNTGTITCPNGGKGALVGTTGGGAYLLGGTSVENAIGVFQYTQSFAYVEGDYTDYIEIDTAEEFLAIESGKKYKLTADIDLGGRTFDNYIFNAFSGVIDGQGHKVFNFNINQTDKLADVAVFIITVERAPFVLKDIQFGSADNLIKVVADPAPKNDDHAGSSCAVLLGGVHGNGTVWFDNVDVYGDLTVNGYDSKHSAGGIIAFGRHAVLQDCNYYGKFALGNFAADNHWSWKNGGAITGSVNAPMYIFGCNNYAELTLANSQKELRLCGIFGYSENSVVVANSNNYGKIRVVTNDTAQTVSNVYVAGIAGDLNKVGAMIYNCENFGEVISDEVVAVKYIGGLVGRVRSGAPAMIDCENNVLPVGSNANEMVGTFTNSGEVYTINFTDVAHQPAPTPPAGDMMIVYVIGAAMVSAIGASVIVYRKRRSLSK